MLSSQWKIFDQVFAAVQANKPLAMFIDACGGTGKTYLLNTLLSAVCKMNGQHGQPEAALAVASNGIAAMLLQGWPHIPLTVQGTNKYK